jgi:hypothetical protein
MTAGGWGQALAARAGGHHFAGRGGRGKLA